MEAFGSMNCGKSRKIVLYYSLRVTRASVVGLVLHAANIIVRITAGPTATPATAPASTTVGRPMLLLLTHSAAPPHFEMN